MTVRIDQSIAPWAIWFDEGFDVPVLTAYT
jgi:hypothetical protein